MLHIHKQVIVKQFLRLKKYCLNSSNNLLKQILFIILTEFRFQITTLFSLLLIMITNIHSAISQDIEQNNPQSNPPTTATKQRPQFVNGVRTKIPDGYDFSTKNVKWSDYDKDFLLRTDAVYQKQVLKDWYRLYSKCYFFNKGLLKYQFFQPEDMYTTLLEPWAFEDQDVESWKGFSPTGRSTNFQIGLGPKQRVANTFNTFYSMPDYYMMCAMRFQKWWRCDMASFDDKSTKFDQTTTILKGHKHYPCFRQYYEASYSCADDIFDYLMQLAYSKKANDFFEGDVSNNEILSFPTQFDNPKAPERTTYTF